MPMQSYIVAKKIEIIRWHRENGKNVHQTSRHFKLDRKRIREWEKNFDNFLQLNYEKAKLRRKLSNGAPVFSEHVDDALFEYLERERSAGRAVSNWILSKEACRDFVKAGAYKGLTPADVVAASDITFCCVSNSHAAKEMVFGNCGVLHEIKDNKGYVEMTSIDPDTSQDISEAIMLRGGRYLEAPVSGSKKPAEDGTLIILAAGDRSLFNDCASCFEAIGRHAFYLGEVGNGSKMSLILNMLLGTTLAGLAEAMALCDRAELSQKDLLEILELGDLNSAVISQKGQEAHVGVQSVSLLRWGKLMSLQWSSKDRSTMAACASMTRLRLHV
ncbi:hypothetical protein HPB52_007184 [Rhipicephalus sanguineus]|uniref:6-phosphogluconate dehydrogenase NADP-binding domain-containing protein n=1 Tax=Rhipicephalus sanguineus TaxID=34632 RepID=A0A9D4T1D1_RHISA|nr:hypothetical protein HPB52_007184 [Rhipicephalus sanguineus]